MISDRERQQKNDWINRKRAEMRELLAQGRITLNEIPKWMNITTKRILVVSQKRKRQFVSYTRIIPATKCQRCEILLTSKFAAGGNEKYCGSCLDFIKPML